jgi:hypothetical protein
MSTMDVIFAQFSTLGNTRPGMASNLVLLYFKPNMRSWLFKFLKYVKFISGDFVYKNSSKMGQKKGTAKQTGCLLCLKIT